jgi:MSHA pilin protein MshD
MYTPDMARRRQSGISLIELVMFIVIVGVGVAGITSAISYSVKNTADPMLRKQAVAIAEALLEEIELQPFTLCDPTDATVLTATFITDCVTQETLGPETIATVLQTRYSATDPFNNVNDYQGFSMPAGDIRGIDNVPIGGLAGYSASVAIVEEAIVVSGGVIPDVPADASLRIDVTVQHGTDVNITLTGYRMRYAPRSPP